MPDPLVIIANVAPKTLPPFTDLRAWMTLYADHQAGRLAKPDRIEINEATGMAKVFHAERQQIERLSLSELMTRIDLDADHRPDNNVRFERGALRTRPSRPEADLVTMNEAMSAETGVYIYTLNDGRNVAVGDGVDLIAIGQHKPALRDRAYNRHHEGLVQGQ